jgi:hypothetical protein
MLLLIRRGVNLLMIEFRVRCGHVPRANERGAQRAFN